MTLAMNVKRGPRNSSMESWNKISAESVKTVWVKVARANVSHTATGRFLMSLLRPMKM
jgi:D-Tyr-tRNAtyr deacylase